MKSLIKTVSILIVLCITLYCAPSLGMKSSLYTASYEDDKGNVVVDAVINTDEDFSELMLFVTYDSRICYRDFDVDENCDEAEMLDDIDCVASFCLIQKELSDTSMMRIYFKPTDELVKGSLLVFTVKAYVKYEGSSTLSEISGGDDCVYVKGVYHVLLGDVNGDGRINTADAVMVLSACAGRIQLSEMQKNAADFNNDNKINTADSTAILQFIVQN